MKNYFLVLLITLLFASCSSDPREQIISDYEQINEGTKTDLNLKVLEIIDLGSITAQDSINILEPEFIEKRDKKIESIKESIKSDESQIQWLKDFDKTYGGNLKSTIETYEMTIGISNNSIQIYESDCKGSFLEWHYNRIAELKKDTSKILYNRVQATYSIINPFLNNVKQELTKTYMFTPDNDSILGVIKE